MREWLLKDEEKNPIGRPKLAREDVLKKAKASIYILCFRFVFSQK